ncbi:MAG: AAA family ATPase [Flavobacteriaceae bacterium]|nr:AAA family ATPase [Flavobacteriaceae bacterium]
MDQPRKPLIIRGARQVGKTTVVKEFAKTYKQKIFLNLEKSSDCVFFFNSDDVHTIVNAIFLKNELDSKDISETLLFIDEIQEYPKAIQLLRYFYEELPTLHVIAAGSLLEFASKEVASFPVGRVEFLYLSPFNFVEYLTAKGYDNALHQLRTIPVKPFAHHVLKDLFHHYCLIGGMPEIVKLDIAGKKLPELIKIYDSLWKTFAGDAVKYAPNGVGKNITKHLLSKAAFFIDRRIKFQNFGESNYKSREVGEVFRRLDQAQIIQLLYPTTNHQTPLVPNFKKSPKLQFLDTGLLNFILGIHSDLLGLDDFSGSYKGSLIPHIIFQELISIQNRTNDLPKFWVRDVKYQSAEVDLVQVIDGKVIPIEIKSGSAGKLRSLHQFILQSNHPYAVRIYGGEFSIQETKTVNGKPFLLMNLPYYLGTQLKEYLLYFVRNHRLHAY